MISGLQKFLCSAFASWRVSVSSRVDGLGAARTAGRGTLECVLENTKISLHFALLTRRCQEPSRVRARNGITTMVRVKLGLATAWEWLVVRPCSKKNIHMHL